MDSIDKKSIDGLMNDGAVLYESNKEAIEEYLKVIIDERYAPK